MAQINMGFHALRVIQTHDPSFRAVMTHALNRAALKTDVDSMFPRKVCVYLKVHKVLQPRRPTLTPSSL
jgi:hypothetical protein